MKYIILVPDGVADEPIAELGGKTPLASAQTPNMDRMAQKGFSGQVRIIPDGLPPGSDIGNMSVLGYDPSKNFSGRAPLEAANLGINLKDNELAIRCNLVTVKDNVMVDYSAGHISIPDAARIVETIAQTLSDSQMTFHVGKSYRHIAVLKAGNPATFLNVACTPPHDIMGQPINAFLPKGEGRDVFLKYMNASRPVLARHPVNQARISRGEEPATMIWLWGQGLRPKLMPFKDKYGLTGSIISAVDLVNGIGRLIGLDVISVPGATGYYDTNYKGKAEYALASLKTKDFVFVHVESTDEAGHNGDARAKVQCIENFDRDVVGTILNAFAPDADVRILITPDHATPVAKRTHTRSLVPFVLYGKGIEGNGAPGYNEASAAKIGLKFASGEDMVKTFINR